MKKRLCIIPARGGSKRFPGKNVAILGDKPLICHTIDTVKNHFDKIIVTSDSDHILQVVKDVYKDNMYSDRLEELRKEKEEVIKSGKYEEAANIRDKEKTLLKLSNEHIFVEKRPAELATDTSKVIDTVLYYAELNKDKFDEVWLCLPTCPLRNEKDVTNAQEMLIHGVDSVLSITEYEFPPSLGVLKGSRGELVSYDHTDPWGNGNTRSQDHPTVYRPNGAIYGSWMQSLLDNKNYYKGAVRGYYMPRERSVDIDTELDFKVAVTLLSGN